MTTPSTPAGWYPDPDGSGGQRYWDGFAWTEHRAPAVAPPAAPEPPADQFSADEQATSVVSLPEQPADPFPASDQATSVVSFTEQPTTVVPRQSTPPSTPDSDEESRAAGAHRAPDPKPFETPSFEAPSFGTPSFETPTFEELSSGSYRTPSYETPPSEAPSSDAPTDDAPADGTPDDDSPSTPPFGTPAFETPAAGAPSYGRPSFEASSYAPHAYDAPPAAFAGLSGPPGASGAPGGPGGGPDDRKLIIGYLSAVGALLLILILVLLYAFVIRDDSTTRIASSGPSTSASKATTSSQSPESTTESATTESPAPPAGDQATEGDFTFSIASTDSGDTVTSPINEYIEKTANGEFFVVYLNVGNSGSAPLTFLSTLQQLKADTDTFAPDDEASFYLGGGVVTINPGEQVETAIAFDVPVGTTPTSIQVHGEPGGAGVELPV